MVPEKFCSEELRGDAQPQSVAESGFRVLLDASTLIGLEHGHPISFSELDAALRERRACLVLTRTNVTEFSASALKTGDFLKLRRELQQIEHLPVVYLREGGITYSELKEAVAAFNDRREFSLPDPYVGRWDETLVLEGPSPAQVLVNQRLDDLVFMLWRQGGLSLTEKRWGKLLKQQFKEDRKLPARVRKAVRRNFREALRRHLALYSILFPDEEMERLADWIYENPARCPGHRLAYEVRQELMNNLTEQITDNDISDIIHTEAAPYVQAMTMDRNTADLCRRAAKRLKKKHRSGGYEERIYSNLGDLLRGKLAAPPVF